MEYNILIGGEAGQGIETISDILEKTLNNMGYYVYSSKDYMSRVKGGHNFTQIRFGNSPIHSHWPYLDLIIALDEKTVNLHQDRLKTNGYILCDTSIKSEDTKTLKIPLMNMAKSLGSPRMVNTVALGAVYKLFGLSYDPAIEHLNARFANKFREENIKALKDGYGAVSKIFTMPQPSGDKNILINGNEACALGALAAGCAYYSAYPMTPSTTIMRFMTRYAEKAGILVEQAEDEIAAINSAIGASYAGIRAMIGTSGGGFSLMVEALGLAGVTETPLVVANVQRPGPATGLSTRTEQSDLLFVISAAQGEFPRMVIALRNTEDAFYQTARAFNLAEKYQIPVIILSDEYLSDCKVTTKPYDFDKITIERYLAEKPEYKGMFKRYEVTSDGISPRIFPSQYENVYVLADSHEHDEYGHISEDIDIRNNMVRKRMKKMERLREELIEPDYFGSEKPELLLIGWGSTYGPLYEAIKLLEKDGFEAGALVFGDIWPLPQKRLLHYCDKAKKIINVEQNYTGQLASLITQQTGIRCHGSILKYDGRQMDSYFIYKAVKEGDY
ncbi:MAG: 2-oxoacid:acceptor oxidoreductase subunit alpha [Clostridiales bacterium]|nr:2-oxoacid:acceptor oxidoreductase subunit alpha [Clostridiales bacterium]